jgi:hypothetical protein
MLPGLLFMLPIVVVDVGGDRLDPDHTRTLVAKELAVEAIAPDDPRAADATGRVEIATKDGKLTVRYRKFDGPIERSIPVASDSARAEIDAAYLAGNLARNEADELTPQRAPAKASERIRESDAESPSGEDDRRYAQLRAYVNDLSSDAQRTSFRTGVLLTAAGALMLTPGIYVAATTDLGEPQDAGIAGASFLMGGVFMTIGVVAMIAKADPYEPLAKSVREQDAKKASSAEAIAGVESEWNKQVTDERSSRRTIAVLSFVLAGLSMGTGAVLAATGTDISPGMTAYIVASGGLNIITGIASLVTEGPMERAQRQWQAVSGAAVPSVGFGLGPIVGGGAASFSVRF